MPTFGTTLVDVKCVILAETPTERTTHVSQDPRPPLGDSWMRHSAPGITFALLIIYKLLWNWLFKGQDRQRSFSSPKVTLCHTLNSQQTSQWQWSTLHLFWILKTVQSYDIEHVTSSPNNPQSDCKMENANKTAKSLLKNLRQWDVSAQKPVAVQVTRRGSASRPPSHLKEFALQGTMPIMMLFSWTEPIKLNTSCNVHFAMCFSYSIIILGKIM